LRDRAKERPQPLCRDRNFGLAGRTLVWLIGSMLPLTGALAQDGEQRILPASEGQPACEVWTDDTVMSPIGQAKPVFASCRGHGLILGYADKFQVFAHEPLEAVLVDLRTGSDRRVVMISLRDDGSPLLENLSGQIAMAAGRGPLSGLEGLEIDTSSFSREGVVGVRGSSGVTEALTPTNTIDLRPQLAELRASRGAPSARD